MSIRVLLPLCFSLIFPTCGDFGEGREVPLALSTGGYCGDGMLSAGEECDGEAVNLSMCQELGMGEGLLSCSDRCTWDLSECTAYEAFCGNGHVDPGEECEPGQPGDASCSSFGYDRGTISCTSNCVYELGECSDDVRAEGVVRPEWDFAPPFPR